MEAAAQPVLARFSAGLAALPKHARLREAIIAAVQAGELLAGMKMTGERELSVSLGLSLGTPAAVIARLNEEINRVMQASDMRAGFADRGVDGGGGTPAQFASFLEVEQMKWARAVKASGATVD
jgi:DNA-binding transcriptional MocR family regulator